MFIFKKRLSDIEKSIIDLCVEGKRDSYSRIEELAKQYSERVIEYILQMAKTGKIVHSYEILAIGDEVANRAVQLLNEKGIMCHISSYTIWFDSADDWKSIVNKKLRTKERSE